MRDVKFRIFSGIGAATPSWKHATLKEFLLESPVFAYELKVFGVMPPLHVLNEILGKGKYDAGMSGACEWKPFEVNSDEYAELVLELTTNPNYKIIEDEDLKEKSNYKRWHVALFLKATARCPPR